MTSFETAPASASPMVRNTSFMPAPSSPFAIFIPDLLLAPTRIFPLHP